VARKQHSWLMLLGALVGGVLGFLGSSLYHRNQNMAVQLRRAIRKNKLRMVYQPIVEIKSGRIVEAEALVRWTDEDGFAISPEIFVGLAEERGFISELTRFVVRQALKDMAETLRQDPGFRLNINVTASDLADPEFLFMLKRTMEEAGIDASSLAIEVTESSTASKQMARDTIHQLRALGHSVQIDDFGTGYSSLAYLKDLSVDAIKIDRSFTQTIGTESVTRALLPLILAMAEALNLQVIVEGIETVEQAEYFASMVRPILGQGWLYGRPVSSSEFKLMLKKGELVETLAGDGG